MMKPIQRRHSTALFPNLPLILEAEAEVAPAGPTTPTDKHGSKKKKNFFSREQEDAKSDAASPDRGGSPTAPLESLLVSPGMAVVGALLNAVHTRDYEDVCTALLTVFHWNKEGQMLITWALEKELKNDEPTVLFRGVSLAATLISKHFRMKAANYLKLVMRPLVKELKNKHVAIEVDPQKLSKTDDTLAVTLKEHQVKLREHSQRIFDSIVSSVDKFPASLKNIFFIAQRTVLERFPEMGYELVGGFFFLRFICPAFVSPRNYGLIESDLAPEVLRTLVLISKVLQNLSNNVRFGEKEAYMMFMNPFLVANAETMQECFKALAQPQRKDSDRAASTTEKHLSYVINEKDKTEALLTLTKYLYDHMQKITSELDNNNQTEIHHQLIDSLKAMNTIAIKANSVPMCSSPRSALALKPTSGGGAIVPKSMNSNGQHPLLRKSGLLVTPSTMATNTAASGGLVFSPKENTVVSSAPATSGTLSLAIASMVKEPTPTNSSSAEGSSVSPPDNGMKKVPPAAAKAILKTSPFQWPPPASSAASVTSSSSSTNPTIIKINPVAAPKKLNSPRNSGALSPKSPRKNSSPTRSPREVFSPRRKLFSHVASPFSKIDTNTEQDSDAKPSRWSLSPNALMHEETEPAGDEHASADRENGIHAAVGLEELDSTHLLLREVLMEEQGRRRQLEAKLQNLQAEWEMERKLRENMEALLKQHVLQKLAWEKEKQEWEKERERYVEMLKEFEREKDKDKTSKGKDIEKELERLKESEREKDKERERGREKEKDLQATVQRMERELEQERQRHNDSSKSANDSAVDAPHDKEGEGKERGSSSSNHDRGRDQTRGRTRTKPSKLQRTTSLTKSDNPQLVRRKRSKSLERKESQRNAKKDYKEADKEKDKDNKTPRSKEREKEREKEKDKDSRDKIKDKERDKETHEKAREKPKEDGESPAGKEGADKDKRRGRREPNSTSSSGSKKKTTPRGSQAAEGRDTDTRRRRKNAMKALKDDPLLMG